MPNDSANDSEEKVSLSRLTRELLAVSQDFLGSANLKYYLPPREAARELLDRGLVDGSGSVVYLWMKSGVLVGLSGLRIYQDSSEAEFWCVAHDSTEGWMVKAAAEAMLRFAFKDFDLDAARTSCERSSVETQDALRASGLFEEGTERNGLRGGQPSRDRMLFGVLRSDWSPDSAKRNIGLVVRCRWEDRYPFWTLLVFQISFLAVLAYFAFVAAGWFSLMLALIPEAVVLYYDRLLFVRIRDERQLGPRLLGPGFILSIGFLVIALASVFYRIRWSAGFSASWILVLLLIGAALALEVAAFSKSSRGKVPWLWIGTLMIGFPIVAVWLPLSDAAAQWTMTPDNLQGFERWRKNGNERARVIAERRAWATDTKRAPRVALALSGGGYRAALIHAGVLDALDRQHVPLAYLTTVSGGSIIGAHYALGYRPSEFIRSTWQQRPGLALDKLSLFHLIGSWLLPWVSDADVYADHFARFYFGRATLEDVPDAPVLIVNATDIEASPQNAREVFSKEMAERSPGLAQSIRVADIVAASGSFPVAFEPKTVRWFASGSDLRQPTIVRRRFVDGGVVENIGFEGLRRYLHLRSALGLDLNKPDVLIVSDASLANMASPLPAKPEIADLLARVQDISYSAFQRSLLRQFTGKDDYARWLLETPFSSQVTEVPYESIDSALAGGEPRILRVVVIAATSPQMEAKLRESAVGFCSFRGRPAADVQREVATLDTLKELSPADVERAAWLGSALVNLYSGAIQCALDKAGNAQSCAARGSLGTCPAFEDIVPDVRR